MQPSQRLPITPFHAFGVRSNLPRCVQRTSDGVVFFASGTRVVFVLPKADVSTGSKEQNELLRGTSYENNTYFLPRAEGTDDLCAFDVKEGEPTSKDGGKRGLLVAVSEKEERLVEEEREGSRVKRKRVLSHVSVYDVSEPPASYLKDRVVFSGIVTALKLGPDNSLVVVYESEKPHSKSVHVEAYDLRFRRSLVSEQLTVLSKDDPFAFVEVRKICILGEDPLTFAFFGCSVKPLDPANCSESDKLSHPVYRSAYILKCWKLATVPSVRFMEIPVVSQLQSTEILGKASPALVDISTPGNNVLVAVDANRIVWTVDVSETDNETSVSSQLQVPVIKGHLPQDADEHSVFSFPYLTCIVATTDGFLLSDSSSNVLSYVRSNVDKASVESPAWEFNGYLKVSSFNDEKAMMVQLTPSCLCYTPFDERITIVVGSPVPLWTMPCLDYKNLSSGVPNRMSELLSLSDREFERCAKAEYERGALPSPFDSAHSSNHMIYPGSAIGILPYELTTVSRSDTFRVIQPVWITDCAHAGRITSLSVPSTCGNSMQTKYMTSCSRDDGTIKIWDMVTRKPILSKCYPWPSAPLRVALHPSGFFLAVYFPGRLHVFVITMASPNITVDDSGADFNQQREEELKNLETFREANRAATKNWNDCFLQWKSYSSRILGMDLASMSSIEMTGIHVIRWSTKGDRIAVSIGTKLYVYQFLNHTPSLFLEDFASCVVGKDLSILGKRGGSRNTLHKQNFPYFFLMGILDASPKAVEDFCFGLEDQYIFVISSDGSQSTFDLRDLVACSSGCVEGDDARSTVDLKGARDDTVAEKSRVWFDETLSPVIYPCGEFSSESGYQTYTSNSVFIDTPPWAAEGGQLSLIPEDVKQADKQNDGPRRGILVSHSHYVSDNSNLTKVFLDGKFSEVRSKEYSQESLREAQTNPIGRCSTICGLCLPYFLRGKQYLSSSVPPFSIALWGGTGQGSIVQLCYPQEETKRPAGGRRRSSVQSTEVRVSRNCHISILSSLLGDQTRASQIYIVHPTAHS
eukprot:gb/GECG01010717.1/.p1 GENE.gb/GECG01010717.1/~~gb/GECG01010717.1/.p1  ORF type:complete len:1031 (+),score=105.69 gb/GECG01010717.1/:1-3093(+)